MPFTFSHPAIVLPFKYFPERWRSMTGLIIGSMAPDFEKFIRMRAFDAYSHTWKSIFYFNLPVALVLAFVFHLVVREVLIDHLPRFIQSRLIKFKHFDWLNYFRKHYGVVILSILIGTVSHIAWDAFTHVDGRFVRWVSLLRGEIAIGGRSMKVYNFLQLGTSVLGLLVVFYAFLKLPVLPVRNSIESERKIRYWVVFTLIAFVIVVLRYIFGYHLRYLSNFVVVMISAGLLSLVITSSLFRKTRSFSRTETFCVIAAFSISPALLHQWMSQYVFS